MQFVQSTIKLSFPDKYIKVKTEDTVN